MNFLLHDLPCPSGRLLRSEAYTKSSPEFIVSFGPCNPSLWCLDFKVVLGQDYLG